MMSQGSLSFVYALSAPFLGVFRRHHDFFLLKDISGGRVRIPIYCRLIRALRFTFEYWEFSLMNNDFFVKFCLNKWQKIINNRSLKVSLTLTPRADVRNWPLMAKIFISCFWWCVRFQHGAPFFFTPHTNTHYKRPKQKRWHPLPLRTSTTQSQEKAKQLSERETLQIQKNKKEISLFHLHSVGFDPIANFISWRPNERAFMPLLRLHSWSRRRPRLVSFLGWCRWILLVQCNYWEGCGLNNLDLCISCVRWCSDFSILCWAQAYLVHKRFDDIHAVVSSIGSSCVDTTGSMQKRQRWILQNNQIAAINDARCLL